MLGWNETIDELAVAGSMHYYKHLMRRRDGHVLRKAIILLEVEG